MLLSLIEQFVAHFVGLYRYLKKF